MNAKIAIPKTPRRAEPRYGPVVDAPENERLSSGVEELSGGCEKVGILPPMVVLGPTRIIMADGSSLGCMSCDEESDAVVETELLDVGVGMSVLED